MAVGSGARTLQEARASEDTSSDIHASSRSFGAMSTADCIKQATPSCAPTNLFGSGSGTYSDTKSSSSFASKLKQLKTPSVKAESSGPTKLEPKEESKSPSQPKSEGKSKEPKYKLFCIPADGLEPDYCLKYKGTG